jgi:hypothetical protein
MFPRDDGDGHELQISQMGCVTICILLMRLMPVQRDGNHHQRTADVRQPHRDVEHEVQRHRHDAGFDREQQEGERA